MNTLTVPGAPQSVHLVGPIQLCISDSSVVIATPVPDERDRDLIDALDDYYYQALTVAARDYGATIDPLGPIVQYTGRWYTVDLYAR